MTVTVSPSLPAVAPVNPLLTGRILPTLVRLSIPNVIAMVATALVAIAETAYVGLLGVPQLAGIALVFPMVMLQQMMSGGAMGGGVSSAISRALGAGDVQRAETLARHAVVIGSVAGIVFTVVFLGWGAGIFRLLGGTGGAVEEALAYSNVAFIGSVGVWLTNTLASVVRGTGNMRVPSAVLLAVAALQVVLSGGLGLGLGPFPRLGMAGIAAGQVIAFAAGALFLAWHLMSGRARIRLRLVGPLRWPMFRDILKVGAVCPHRSGRHTPRIELRDGSVGRIWHRRAARVFARADHVRDRCRKRAHGRNGDRLRQCGPGAGCVVDSRSTGGDAGRQHRTYRGGRARSLVPALHR